MNLTMQQASRSVTDKYKKELRTEDFLLLTQENKEYKQLIKILQEKGGILSNKIAELEKSLMRMENEKDQYKALCQEYTIKFNHYERIKNELLQEYRVLKNEIQHSFQAIATKDVEIAELKKVNESNVETLMQLQQNAKRDQLVIEELRQHVAKLQKEIIHQKIATFSHLVDHRPAQHTKKENIMSKSNTKPSPSISFKSSTINATSIRSSNNNSISFSLLSNEAFPPHKSSITKKHNKSIYI